MNITPNMYLNDVGKISSMLRTSAAIAGRGRTRNAGSYATANAKSNVSNYYNRQASGYATIGGAAESLRSTAASFASNSVTNVFTSARKNQTADGLYTQAKGMVTSYNNTLKGLNDVPSSLNRVYGQMMRNAVNENRDALRGIGITVNRDNTISINERKFKEAGIDEIEKALGAEAGFSKRMANVSENVADSAVRNAAGSLFGTGLYNSPGRYNAAGLYSAFGLYGATGGYTANSAYLNALLSAGSRFDFCS